MKSENEKEITKLQVEGGTPILTEGNKHGDRLVYAAIMLRRQQYEYRALTINRPVP